MSRAQKIFLTTLQALFLIFSAYLMIYDLLHPEYNKIGAIIFSLILVLLPQIIQKLFKLRIRFIIQLTYLIFLFCALYLGIILDFYKTLPHFDKLMHFCSGVLSVLIGYFALKFFKIQSSNKIFKATFIISVSVSIAVFWEFFEFFCDKVLGQSMQEIISLGVDDTMFDLIAATIGSIVGTWLALNTKIAASTIDKQVPAR